MKPMTVYFIVCILTLISCATPADVVKYDDTNYLPKPDTYEIPILDRANIDQPFKVIAEVSNQSSPQMGQSANQSRENAIESLKEAARELGGDALIDFETERVETSAVESPRTNVKALVIVYE